MAGYIGEAGCSRSKLFKALLVISANPVSSCQHTVISSVKIRCWGQTALNSPTAAFLYDEKQILLHSPHDRRANAVMHLDR